MTTKKLFGFILISLILFVSLSGCSSSSESSKENISNQYNIKIVIEGVIDENHVGAFSISSNENVIFDQFNFENEKLIGEITGLSEAKKLNLLINNDILKNGEYVSNKKEIIVSPESNSATFKVDFKEYATLYGYVDVFHNFPTSTVDSFVNESVTSNELNEENINREININYKEEQRIIRFSDGVSEKEKQEILSEFNFKIIDENRILNAYLVEIAEPVDEINAKIQNTNEIKYIESNDIFNPSSVRYPNDEYFNLQWHYSQIRLPQTWSQTTGSSSVRVAVLDSGLDISHPDIGENIDKKYGYDFVNNRKDFMDYDGHGTHVAGTIGADTNNSRGMAGVMWEVDLLPVKVIGPHGAETWHFANGLLYAAGLLDNPFNPYPSDIINMSLGSISENAYISEIIRIVDRETNAIMVGAAGNDYGSSIGFPAALSEVIAVGAVDYNYPNEPQQAPYSNQGREMEVVAPGGNSSIDSNNNNFPDGVFSTVKINGYLYYPFDGTSMSAPHVSGVIGLMLSQGIPHRDVRKIIHQTAIDLGSKGHNRQFGYGLINSYWAINRATEMKIIVGDFEGDNIKIIDKTTISSQGGEFRLDSIPEGDHRVFAWVDVKGNGVIEAGDYFGISEYFYYGSGKTYDIEGYISEVYTTTNSIDILNSNKISLKFE